jgi:RimJ/RimL family protein N-acetyltransferase
MPFTFPEVIRTERLVLRPWRPADAPRLKEAIDANLERLQAWMPWAMNEPSTLEEIAARLERFAEDFAAGVDGTYGIFTADEARVVGGTGLHPRIEEGFEIGYWLVSDRTGHGYATEAASALTRVAFSLPATRQVQIRCDPRNRLSYAVAKRLGFVHVDTLVGDTTTPAGESRDTMIWQMTRERLSNGAPALTTS